MAALHLLAGLTLSLLLRSTLALPARPAWAAVGAARRWWTRLPYAVRLLTRRRDADLPQSRGSARPAGGLPRPRSLLALLHRAQPCAP
ncbi:hypothetical protein [Streptomyces sp. NPDC015130]|uniref:hypothetical protein n=1 Tax=Streptomyces sp. NPDC015130 TaxID=3364940 RepID=UPI0036FE936D